METQSVKEVKQEEMIDYTKEGREAKVPYIWH